jgi:acyl carrier protein
VSDQNHYGWFSGVVDNASCLCRYTDDVQGQLWFSKSAIGHRNGLAIRIYGDKGSAEWLQINPENLILAYGDGRREVLDRASAVEVTDQRRYNRFKAGHPAGFLEAFANLYTDIADALLQYKDTGKWVSQQVFSAELALEGMYFLEAMVNSAKTHSWQLVGNVNNDSSSQIYHQKNKGVGEIDMSYATPMCMNRNTDLEIRTFIISLLQKKSKLPINFNDTSDFIDEGIVDSMALIKFTLELESQFDIEILDADIESEDFRSVASLVRMIECKLNI